MHPEKSSVKSSVKIIKLMQENRGITIIEIASAIGLTTRAVEKQIAKLKKEGLITREGPEKGGFWIVTKNKN